MWYAEHVKTAEEMHGFLAERLFPDSADKVKERLADRWQVDTANGYEYLQQHGLHVLSQAALEMRNGNHARCTAIHDDLRSDVMGLPIAEYGRCKLFDACCSSKNMTMKFYNFARRSRVFTPESVHLAYPECKPQQATNTSEAVDTDAVMSATDDTLGLASPPKPKRKRTKT